MKLRSILSLGFAALLATALLGLAGCDPGDFGPDKTTTVIKNDKGDILGIIFFDIDGDDNFDIMAGDVPLEGVKVTFTDSEGDAVASTTDANGQWGFEGITGGGYASTYEKDGYLTQEGDGILDFGDFNGDGFEDQGTSSMQETPLTATVTWTGGSAELSEIGQDQAHGFMDFSAIYTQATDGSITVTFSADLLSGDAEFRLTTGGSDRARHDIDPATSRTVVTLLEGDSLAADGVTVVTGIDTAIAAEIASSGTGIAQIGATDITTIINNNVFCASGNRITPIHGVLETLDECFGILVKP